jgi:hypothetical protein
VGCPVRGPAGSIRSPKLRTWVRFPSPAPYGCAFRSLSIRAISHFRRSILARSCRDSGTRLVSQKRRFPWASMTGQSVNPEQPLGRGATRLELGTKSNEEPNLAPTYSEYRFLENVNRRGQKSGSPVPAAHFASAARFQLPRINSPGTRPPSLNIRKYTQVYRSELSGARFPGPMEAIRSKDDCLSDC